MDDPLLFHVPTLPTPLFCISRGDSLIIKPSVFYSSSKFTVVYNSAFAVTCNSQKVWCDYLAYLSIVGETLPLATSNQIMLRFTAKSGPSTRGFHFVYQGMHAFTSVIKRSKTHMKPAQAQMLYFVLFVFLSQFSLCQMTPQPPLSACQMTLNKLWER